MSQFALTPQQLRTTTDAALFRRTLALLQLDAGQPIVELAWELQVSRRSIERWVNSYLHNPTPRALLDHRGHAHVTAWDEDLQAVLRTALERSPQCYGYIDLEWTVPLFQEHLLRWDGRHWSDTTIRRQLHSLGYVWKRPRYVLLPDPQRTRKLRRIRQRIEELGPRTSVLFEDETDLLLFPPLRACWAQRGEPAAVTLSGRNARRVIFGTIHVHTGHRLLLARRQQRGDDFQAFLHVIHEHYRGWKVVLLLDEDSSHTAGESRVPPVGR